MGRESAGWAKTYAVAAVCAALATSGKAGAVDFRAGSEPEVASGEVLVGDLYVAGDRVRISGEVVGDVVAAGREVVVDGVIHGDLIAAAQVVSLEGEVRDDVRAAGLAVRLAPSARVGDHLLAAGFSLAQEAGAVVTGELVFSGFQALIAGIVGGDATVAAAGLDLRGQVDGSATVEVEPAARRPAFFDYLPLPVALPEVAPGLTVRDSAIVAGELRYRSSAEVEIPARASLGRVVFEPREPEAEAPAARSVLLSAARKGAALLIAGAVLLWLWPRTARRWVAGAGEAFLQTLGVGILVAVGVPVLALALAAVTGLLTVAAGLASLDRLVALFVAAGLLAQGLLAGGAWLCVAIVGPVVAALCTGVWILAVVRRGSTPVPSLPSLALGLVVLVPLGLVPIVGTLVAVAVGLVGLGGVGRWVLALRSGRDAGGEPAR